MDAGQRRVTDIFTITRVLRIPFFQRGYVWGQDDWSRFLDDMVHISRTKQDYFLGSLILKSEDTPTDRDIGDRRSVIDGQQRLTTIVIFFKVLTDLKNDSALFKRVFYNVKNKTILEHNHMDEAVFNAIVYDRLTADIEAQYSNNNLLRCYHYFMARQNEFPDIDPTLLLNKLYFVGIDLGRDEDEQQIFDTINSLGVRLTVAELLKNHLFSRNCRCQIISYIFSSFLWRNWMGVSPFNPE